MERNVYAGKELEIFEHAVNWKRYFANAFRPYIRGRVVEVGAGIGANVSYLINKNVDSYTCIEPDAKLASIINEKIKSGSLPAKCSVRQGRLDESVNGSFDTMIYIDVLEHIEDDKVEVEKAAEALSNDGHLCILVPANPSDYSAFDRALGHYRRYSKRALKEIISPGLQITTCRHLDFFGQFAAKANRFVLKQSQPTLNQVLFWDRWLVPASKFVDGVLGYRYGKSLLLVAEKKR